MVELEADRPSKRVLRDPACPSRQPAGNMIQRALDGLGVGVSSAARDAGASPPTILGSCNSMEYSMGGFNMWVSSPGTPPVAAAS